MNEDIDSALKAAAARDINTIRAITQIQLNDMSNSFANLAVIISTLNPELLSEYNGAVTFAIQDVTHVINKLFGDETEVTPPVEPTDGGTHVSE